MALPRKADPPTALGPDLAVHHSGSSSRPVVIHELEFIKDPLVKSESLDLRLS
jgi:hypothetical protein